MLPGNLQYWQPCKWLTPGAHHYKGTIDYNIKEPIHFAGPSPGEQSAIIEEKKEQIETSQTNQLPATDQDDPNGAAQQSSPDLTIEETKEPEPSQTVEPAGGAAISAPSVDTPHIASQKPIASEQQSVDVNQATLEAFKSILAQQLEEKLEAKFREQDQRNQSTCCALF